MNDLSSQTHDQLDNEITTFLSSVGPTIESHDATILYLVLVSCRAAYADIWPVNQNMDLVACGKLLASRADMRMALRIAYEEKKYAKIRNLRM